MTALGKNRSWIVFLTTFPPRECGIATFTQDLSSAFNQLYAPMVQSKIVAMNIDDVRRFNYPKKVIDQINQSKIEDYVSAAKKLNSLPQVKLVNIQHEFGIFGDGWGSNLIAFLETIRKPVVITLHSVLPQPEKTLKEVVTKLAAKTDLVTVFTKLSKDILIRDYQIDVKKIQIIPHGIHPVVFSGSDEAKAPLNLSGRTILTSFGFLNSGKGIEYVIDALPEVIKAFPKVLYLVIGATHPLVLQKEGEEYRNFLIDKVYKLKLSGHVRFYNRYLELNELLEFLKATDIYLSSSLNPDQAVSGTLSYALGTGRAVVSTAFAQAKEDVTADVGILVDFQKPKEFTLALIKLLRNESLRKNMEKNAYFNTRDMTWPNVAIAYMRNFAKLAPDLLKEEKHLPKIKLKHLIELTDDFGIIQFAKMDQPDPSSGYTLDDNARALVFATGYYEKYKTPAVLKLISVYLDFIQFVSRADGFFDNYAHYDRSLNEQRNKQESMEDASARALYSLALVVTTRSIPRKIRERAKTLFYNSIKNDVSFTYVRSCAFYIKGLSLWLSKWGDARVEAGLIQHCDLLVQSFQKHAKENWQWFEDHLTYANATIPEALLSAYPLVGERKDVYFRIGKTSLDFLISQTFREDMYVPIGHQGWYPRDGQRGIYDQQPEDASAMVQALKTMYQITGKEIYRKLMHRAFSWFLGDNILHQIIYDETTGGCYDGMGQKYINLNQGAESTVSYLLARIVF